MRRWMPVLMQASLLVLAGALYFFFVLPRWFLLTGEWPQGLGTAMRIVCGVLVGLAALPVVFTLLRTRKPEFGTPKLALSLRLWSIVLHVLAGVLIVGTAISEIWLSLDSVGSWLFGIYGAAAAIAVLGALAFYLAYAAELPPPPPKPLRPKSQTRRRGRAETAEAAEAAEADAEEADADEVSLAKAETLEAPETPETGEVSETPEVAEKVSEESTESDVDASDATEVIDSEDSGNKLRNRRPTGKSSPKRFRRTRGGVALDD